MITICDDTMYKQISGCSEQGTATLLVASVGVLKVVLFIRLHEVDVSDFLLVVLDGIGEGDLVGLLRLPADDCAPSVLAHIGSRPRASLDDRHVVSHQRVAVLARHRLVDEVVEVPRIDRFGLSLPTGVFVANE